MEQDLSPGEQAKGAAGKGAVGDGLAQNCVGLGKSGLLVTAAGVELEHNTHS